MEETFEANTQDDDHVKEWMVEFIAVVNDTTNQHLSVLYGTDKEDVQRALLHELRRIYELMLPSFALKNANLRKAPSLKDSLSLKLVLDN